ncbi:MAG: phosphoesterase [Candidatus Hydrogenedentota bacterium]
MRYKTLLLGLMVSSGAVLADIKALPGPFEDGYLLPNGWRISPSGTLLETQDLLLSIVPTPDGTALIGLHGGFNAHGLVVVDAQSDTVTQRIPLPTAWLGLAWSPDGNRLFVSGGSNKTDEGVAASIYVLEYTNGRLGEKPVAQWNDTLESERTYWSGLAHHPSQPRLFAGNRVTNEVVVLDSNSGQVTGRVKVEQNPYDLAVSPDGRRLFCSNWASASVSVINTESLTVERTLRVGNNPNDLLLDGRGRLFVSCGNDNTVWVIDSESFKAIETIFTSMHERAPEGSTPNAMAVNPDSTTLFVANADNYNVCVVDVSETEESNVLGFIPSGWYPSAIALSADGMKLLIGNGKGTESYSNIRGPLSPLPPGEEGAGNVKSLQKGAIQIISVAEFKDKLPELTRQAYRNCPYNDELLVRAKPSATPTVVPSDVGVASPIKHVLYIIKENRTYDQVFGDLPQGNGDPRLAIFGREITPNHHAIAEQFVLLDNLYCDAEVSWDGHQWSNAAYATDYVEKTWPASYGGKSHAPLSTAMFPSAGYIWDQCAKKGLTYRSYGEFAEQVSDGTQMAARVAGLMGHVAPNYGSWDARDTDNAKEFIREFDEYEKNYSDSDPDKRLPNFMVMSLPEDHTRGTRPGEPTPRASVASNDLALGQIIDRVSHSKYWNEMAVFVIEDDAQNGPDHVDARRTVGLVVSPYCHRGIVDSTFYTTSSMLRTIELLLGLQPMSQYDAAANPMYASLSDKLDPEPYTHLPSNIDLNEINQATAWGADESMKMDFSDYDRTPMLALNEIVWKSVRGADSDMPLPVSRFHEASVRLTD